MNTAYKIASACMAERFKSVLISIINDDQRGFMSDRGISDNLRLLYDILLYTDINDVSGQILLIDFEKAFDSLAWSFVDKCLTFFNFGPMIKRWIKTFYTNITSCISVNGSYSEWFSINRGCRQGDPCSPYIFLLCSEILSLLIRQNENIKGINLGDDVNALLSQFADDATFYLDGSKRSFENCIITLKLFASISGLKINYEKTQVIWIGSRKNSDTVYLPELNLTWNPPCFKVLGVVFSTDLQQIGSYNYDGKLDEIRRLLLVWSRRYLTPFGKITILKTLALSKLVYLFSSIPDPPETFITELEKLFYDFLWDKKPSKIKKTIVCAKYEMGGLKMPDVKSFISSMKIKWLSRINSDNYLNKRILTMLPELRNIKEVGGTFIKFTKQTCLNPFWRDVLKHYELLHTKCPPTDYSTFLAESIHCNNGIRRNNNTIYMKNWIESGITKIRDICNSNGMFLTFEEFKIKTPTLKIDFLTYHGILRAVEVYRKRLNIKVVAIPPNTYSKTWSVILSKNKKATYEMLISTIEVPTATLRWTDQCNYNIDWKLVFNKTRKITDLHKRWFQLRILHRIIATQNYLFKINLVNDNLCSFCKNETESILHLFWECVYTQMFWADVHIWLYINCIHLYNFNFSEQLVIFGYDNSTVTDSVIDSIILLGKYHIFKSKNNGSRPSIQCFKRLFYSNYIIEQHRCTMKYESDSLRQQFRMYEKLVRV